MPRQSLAALLLALGLGACGMLPPPPPSAGLPADIYSGAADPTRTAIYNTGIRFSSPEQLAGKPADAARAIGEMEYLVVELLTNPRFFNATQGSTTMPAAKAEWRGALGIAPTALPQTVIDAMFAAVRALNAGQPAAAQAALSGPAFTLGGAATLQRLGALPNLPATNQAALAASQVLRRIGSGRF